MVRGTQKQIIHLKTPESSLFEEAFLIVKPQPARQTPTRTTMVEEANRLLSREGQTPTQVADGETTKSNPRLLLDGLLYVAGALTGAVITMLCLL
ncbi:MAG: hypothetical protein IJC29_00910 [Clostridia bacterium]|nr:hypothetical protein [Clostridia bacterium]